LTAKDVYDDSPTLVTIWLTIMPKLSILIFLLEMVLSIDINLNLIQLINTNSSFFVNSLTNLLLLSSVLSLFIGAIVGLSQIRIKRLLAFSTINHVGFLLLALSVFSNLSIEAFIFYLVQYTITNLNIFLILLAFGYSIKYKISLKHLANKQYPFIEYDIEYINDLKGQFFDNPILSISLAISLFSFAGKI
jgi:NADH-ubiquinone oxidoreductase chain 2